jgi:hypothetical protein
MDAVFFPHSIEMLLHLATAANTPLSASPRVIRNAANAGSPSPFPSGPAKLLSAILPPVYRSKTSTARHCAPYIVMRGAGEQKAVNASAVVRPAMPAPRMRMSRGGEGSVIFATMGLEKSEGESQMALVSSEVWPMYMCTSMSARVPPKSHPGRRDRVILHA